MADKGGDEFAIGGQSGGVGGGLQFGELGPCGRIKRADLVVVGCGEDLLTIARPCKWGGSSEFGCGGVDGDELVAVATVENANWAIQTGRGDVLASWGELGLSDIIIMLEWADESLPRFDAPNARFAFVSPRGKPRRIWTDVHGPYTVSASHVDELFIHLSVPHTCPVGSATDHPLVILRRSNGPQLHFRLLSDLSTV